MERHTFAKIGSIVIAISVLFVCGESRAAGKSKSYKATCAGGYTGDPNLSYDGEANNPAAVGNLSGSDNVGGDFIAQDYAETSTTAGSACTAPDGTAGTNFALIADHQINTDASGDQMHLSFSAGEYCASNTTSSFSGTEEGTVTGGTGKLAKASGTISETYAGVIVAAPATPGFGYILTLTETLTGTVTK